MAPSIVQSMSGFSGNNSLNVSFLNPVTAGNMILVWVGLDTTTAQTINLPTMTGETFVAVAGATEPFVPSASQLSCFAVNSANGGQTTVSGSCSNCVSIHLHMAEISGQGVSPQDAVGAAGSSTSYSVSTSSPTSVGSDLIIAAFMDGTNNRAWTSGSGYTRMQITNTAFPDSMLSEFGTVSSTGVQTATASYGATGDVVAMGIIAISPPGPVFFPIGSRFLYV